MRNVQHESTGGSLFLLGAIAGALVGAGVALLMAPKPGAQVRQDINAGWSSLRDAASRRYRDLADRAGEQLDNLEAAGREAMDNESNSLNSQTTRDFGATTPRRS